MWKDKTYYRKLRIQGEWIKINCAITTSETVTLWFGKSKGETTKKLEVDDKKIKLISKNVFNMTNLTTEDQGWYTCQVCGKKLVKFVEVPDQGTQPWVNLVLPEILVVAYIVAYCKPEIEGLILVGDPPFTSYKKEWNIPFHRQKLHPLNTCMIHEN